jgi:hypothetical protein
MIFKILIILVATWFIFRLIKNYNQEKSDLLNFMVWLIVWLAVIVFMVHPTLGSDAAKFFGIGRGTDLVFFIAFIIMFYFVFRLYTKTTAVESDVTETVKYVALINHKLDEKNRRKSK